MNKTDIDIVDWAKVVLSVLVIAVIVNAGVTSTVQRFACPSMTETQVFLNLPNSFLWKFKHCPNE